MLPLKIRTTKQTMIMAKNQLEQTMIMIKRQIKQAGKNGVKNEIKQKKDAIKRTNIIELKEYIVILQCFMKQLPLNWLLKNIKIIF